MEVRPGRRRTRSASTEGVALPPCRGDGGAALLEFAFAVPFLAVLVFGVIDLGRAYSLQDRLTNMAREGGMYAQYFPAEVASQSSTDNCAAQSITTRALGEDPSLTGVTITVTDVTTSTVISGCNAQTIEAGDRIQIKAAETNFQPLTPLVSAITGPNVTISGSIQVVVQG